MMAKPNTLQIQTVMIHIHWQIMLSILFIGTERQECGLALFLGELTTTRIPILTLRNSIPEESETLGKEYENFAKAMMARYGSVRKIADYSTLTQSAGR